MGLRKIIMSVRYLVLGFVAIVLFASACTEYQTGDAISGSEATVPFETEETAIQP